MRRNGSGFLIAALVLTGCGGPAPAPSAPIDLAAQFNLTDRAWLELMLPMDQQVLPALQLAATHSANPRVRTFAAGYAQAVQAELDRLRPLAGQAVLSADNPHAGMKMPGLVDVDTLSSLAQSPPAAFDPALLSTVRDNIAQAAALADGEQRNGAQPEVKALAVAASTLRRRQQAELTALTATPTPL